VKQSKTYLTSDAIADYVRAVSVHEPAVLERLREETAALPQWEMQIAPEQGQLLRVLLATVGAKKTLEIGVFTGYSSIVTALALPPDGRVVACDISDEFTQTARRYWREAGVEHKIELRLGPAATSLRNLIGEGAAGTFDFAFIDADKERYDEYYELSLDLVRPGGLLMLDNMLRRGHVLDQSSKDSDVKAIQLLNRKIHQDKRVTAVLLPFVDGVTIACKG
jgi:caffeoyl-CoA O-methyltransferase